jgi:hypothetical protein
VSQWLGYQRSKSHVGTLPPADRDLLLSQIADIVNDQFPDRQMWVSYRSRLRVAMRLS